MSEKTPVEQAAEAMLRVAVGPPSDRTDGTYRYRLAHGAIAAAVEDRERLARVIWEASRSDESTISATGANIVAYAVARWLTGEES